MAVVYNLTRKKQRHVFDDNLYKWYLQRRFKLEKKTLSKCAIMNSYLL